MEPSVGKKQDGGEQLKALVEPEDFEVYHKLVYVGCCLPLAILR